MSRTHSAEGQRNRHHRHTSQASNQLHQAQPQGRHSLQPVALSIGGVGAGKMGISKVGQASAATRTPITRR
jgi:hypothetical protein